MAETTNPKIHHIKIGDRKFDIGNNLLEELGLTKAEFATLLTRDFYTPILTLKPSAETLTYIDPVMGELPFRTAMNCIYPDNTKENGVGVSFFVGTQDGKAIWRSYDRYYSKTYDLTNNTYISDISYEDGGYDDNVKASRMSGNVTIKVNTKSSYKVTIKVKEKFGNEGVISTKSDTYAIGDCVIIDFYDVDIIQFSSSIPIWVESITVLEIDYKVTKISLLENDEQFTKTSVVGETIIFYY